MEDTFAVRIIAGIALIIWLVLMVVVPLKLWNQVKRMDARYRELNPTAHSLKWGYIFGGASCFFGVLASIGFLGSFLSTSISDVQDSVSNRLAAMYFLVWAAPLAVSGYFACRRKRWAWILATILSLNPIIWVVNFFYGMRRWKEFDLSELVAKKSNSASFMEENHSKASGSVERTFFIQKSTIIFTGILVLVALLFPPHTIQIPDGWKVNVGFKFLFHEGVEAVNLELLIVEVFAIVVAGALIWFLAKR